MFAAMFLYPKDNFAERKSSFEVKPQIKIGNISDRLFPYEKVHHTETAMPNKLLSGKSASAAKKLGNRGLSHTSRCAARMRFSACQNAFIPNTFIYNID